jgi:hypothetical protein
MHYILIALLGMALIGALVLAVASPRIPQRAIALAVSLLVISLFAYTTILLLQKRSEVWNYGQNIRPTNELLSLVAEDIQAGRFDQATKRLDLIAVRWREIHARPNAYSASDILREIRSSDPPEQSKPKPSEQDGGGNALEPSSRPSTAPTKSRATP